jgi:NAD(P)-dependent dehydrogenase (short-subunit alcohol dehydrogenase family)
MTAEVGIELTPVNTTAPGSAHAAAIQCGGTLMGRLDGKVALVTGGAVGIGAACVARMVEAGARVAIVDLHDEIGQTLATQYGGNARYFHADVSVESEVAAAIAGTMEAFGRLDVLVNNAGIAGPNKPTHDLTEAEWDRVQAINVKGVFFGTKHAIAPLRAAGGGSIINLSSIYGLVGAPDLPPYHASKGAVRLMSKTDALTYAADRIRVKSIHPGFIWTPMVEQHIASMGGDPVQHRRETGALHPLGHMGDPDDIAWGVVYLASDESKFVTGSELVIDGGYTCR